MRYTTEGVRATIKSKSTSYQERAKALKDQFQKDREAINANDRLSQEAKLEDRAKLHGELKQALQDLREAEERDLRDYVRGIEAELFRSQPNDASSVLLRRDARDRARKLETLNDALSIMQEAIRTGDESMAFAVADRARANVWPAVLDAYKEGYPEQADTAMALSEAEGLTSGPAYNVATSIAYSAPADAY